VWEVGNLETACTSLETAEAYKQHMNNVLTGCSVGALDLRANQERKGAFTTHSVMFMGWHNVHSMNGPIVQRHNQLTFNQEIKSL
jgi:hypothetical protein